MQIWAQALRRCHPAARDLTRLLIIDEVRFVPLSKTGAELLFEVISQRYERGSTLITSWLGRYGYRQITALLRDAGWAVNLVNVNPSTRPETQRIKKEGVMHEFE